MPKNNIKLVIAMMKWEMEKRREERWRGRERKSEQKCYNLANSKIYLI